MTAKEVDGLQLGQIVVSPTGKRAEMTVVPGSRRRLYGGRWPPGHYAYRWLEPCGGMKTGQEQWTSRRALARGWSLEASEVAP